MLKNFAPHTFIHLHSTLDTCGVHQHAQHWCEYPSTLSKLGFELSACPVGSSTKHNKTTGSFRLLDGSGRQARRAERFSVHRKRPRGQLVSPLVLYISGNRTGKKIRRCNTLPCNPCLIRFVNAWVPRLRYPEMARIPSQTPRFPHLAAVMDQCRRTPTRVQRQDERVAWS